MTGSRDVTNKLRLAVEAWINSLPDNATVYRGACIGADVLAAKTAKVRGLHVVAVVPYNRKRSIGIR